MKLLCDVCEGAVASLVCCADEAALCSSCDSRVHAANKLASKHQRIPLLSEASEPASCDICQERPSFFFCVEDRALLCRECDESIHSANALAAKHRRFLLTGIKVGSSPAGSTSQDTSSIDHQQLATSPAENANPTASKKLSLSPGARAEVVAAARSGTAKEHGGFGNSRWNGSKVPSSPHQPQASKASSPRAPTNIETKSLGRYTITKDGTLSMASNTKDTGHRRKAAANTRSNSTTISIQRISAGQRAPFVAPVLSSIHAYLAQEEATNNNDSIKHNDNTAATMNSNTNDINSNTSNIEEYSNNGIMMDMGGLQPVEDDNISDYLNPGVPGWRLDELLTDLVGVCDSGRSLSPPKDNIVPGFGLQEEQSWFAELDCMDEDELSPSQEEGVALVPEMPSPPTHSGLASSHTKPICPVMQPPWAFDYLFAAPDHSNEFSVVPDIGGHRSSPVSSPASPLRGKITNKKRKFWHNM